MVQKNIKKIEDTLLKLKQGKVTAKQALKNIKPAEFLKLLQPQLAFTKSPSTSVAGVAVSPGLAVGKISFTAKTKEKFILVKEKITQRDYLAIKKAEGIIVIRGGAASPGILMARSLGVPVIVIGDSRGFIDKINNCLVVGKKVINQGETVAVDGYQGKLTVGEAKIFKQISELTANRIIKLIGKEGKNNILSFISSVEQASVFNKKGFGLAIRSEDLIATVPNILEQFQNYILAADKKKKKAYLKKLMALQVNQYKEIFQSNKNKPIIIRLFDPPFSEFFPSIEDLFIDLLKLKESLIKTNNSDKKSRFDQKIKEMEILLLQIRSFNEDNKMLGHRGCRFAITHPDIYQSQVAAIFQALAKTIKKKIKCCPNISIPMVIDPQEVKIIKKLIKKAEAAVEKQYKVKLTYKLGAAIETPRAVALAEQLAAEVDFFSFGTNDLTQLVMGISRTDYNSFLPQYKKQHILKNNPFDNIDSVVADLIIQVVEAAIKKNNRIFFFNAIKDFREAKMVDKIFKHKGYIVSHPSLAPIVKLSLLQ